MLYKYDHALLEKFKKVFNPVIYAPTDKFYERYLLGNNNDKVELPALSLWRTSFEIIPYNMRTQLRIPNDRRLLQNKELAREVSSVQVRLNYQLDIWAGTDTDRDDLLSELLYFLTLYPDVRIEYKGFIYEFPVLLQQSPDDVTDIANFESTGDMYRISIPLEIPDARLLYYQDKKTVRFLKYSLFVDDELVIGEEKGGCQ